MVKVDKGGGRQLVIPVRKSSVQADIGLWRNKVKPGGILCGHDCELHPEAVGKELLLKNKHADALEWGKGFRHTHPGSTLAVHEVLSNVSLFSDSLLRLADGSRGNSMIWWVKI